MSQMPYPRVVAILEGGMERAFVNANFHYAHVMPISNGITWSVPAMIKQVGTLIGTISYEFDLIVIWFDREGRAETSDEICAAVREALSPSLVAPDKLCVVVCDRMTENLFLLDADLLLKEGISEKEMPESLGQNGKAIVKGLFKAQGRKYSETFDGVRMLKALKLGSCAAHCPQAAALKASLPECWWG